MVETDKKSTFKTYSTAIIVASITAFVVLVIAPLIGVPLYQATAKSHQELQDKNAELKREQTRLETLKGLQDKKDQLVAQNQKVLAALPNDTDVARLFIQFESLASQNGVNVTSVSETGSTATANTNGSVQPSGSLTPITYTVSGTASSYAGIKNLLAKSETALRILSIDKIDISGTANALTVNMQVTTYERGTGK